MELWSIFLRNYKRNVYDFTMSAYRSIFCSAIIYVSFGDFLVTELATSVEKRNE